MYNRYIPQPDGSYTRNKMQEPFSPQRRRPPSPPPAPEKQPDCPPPHKEQTHICKQKDSPIGFLRPLLRNDFDTGDLIVVLLLLLMAGDCQEDKNNAILTIALYFLM
jgi:hypothetical protein